MSDPFDFEAQLAERRADPEWVAKWTVGRDKVPLTELERHLAEIACIHKLRAEEGDSVTILCDNPEGPPNNAVECCGAWTDWSDRRFHGETLLGALRAAVEARQSTEIGA